MQECRKQNVEEYHSCGYRSFSILYSAFCILHYSWFAALMISTKSAGFRRRKVRCMRNALAGISFCAPLRLLSPRSPRGGLRGGPVLILKYAPFAAPHPVGPRVDLPYGGMRID